MYAKQLGIAIEEGFGLGKIQLEIFEKTVEEKLRAPCFITAYPTEVSPLARRNELDLSVTARFEFFIAGQEIANGFSELNDPDDQADRFRRQANEKEAGHEEACTTMPTMSRRLSMRCRARHRPPEDGMEVLGEGALVSPMAHGARILIARI